MGDLTDQASGCFKVVFIFIISIAIITFGLFYCFEQKGVDKSYQQGVKDALSGHIDSSKLKK